MVQNYKCSASGIGRQIWTTETTETGNEVKTCGQLSLCVLYLENRVLFLTFIIFLVIESEKLNLFEHEASVLVHPVDGTE